ncbi:MAG TPA: hypothetical protein VGJ13_02015 [Pseudonocardiaceae bacterium]|jgi:hypothetical protein
MTQPEGTGQDTELDSTSSIIEGSANTLEKPAEGAATGDYQARLREFDNVESAPVTSLPEESRNLDASDLEV